MARIGFVGPSYSSQSINADAQRSINWYPEIVESQGKAPMALYPTPGLSVFAKLAGESVRGLFTINGRTFAIAGINFYEISAAGVATLRGTGLIDDGLPATMAASPQQLLISSGGGAYVLNLQTNVFQALAPGVLTGVAAVGYSDGFFIALLQNSQQFQISSPLDATTWPALQLVQVSVFPDNVLGMTVDHREIWLFGGKASVVYYDSGSLQIFDVIPGAYIEQGTIAAFSPAKLDNSVFWLGGDERGAGIAWIARGYTPARISNHAVENEWQGYATLADAIGYAYQDRGHTFYVLSFPTANKTWAFDAATGMWHERAFWNNVKGAFDRHRSQNHTFNFGRHLVGDWQTGNVYTMSIATLNDFGNAIRRVRRAPHVAIEQEWVFHHELQVDLEAGLGPLPPLVDGNANPRDPQIFLRFSDDGGHTWSNEYAQGAGQAGQFKTRVIWRRLGRSRNRVYEIAVSDPIPWRIIEAYLKATPGFIPQERLVHQFRKVG